MEMTTDIIQTHLQNWFMRKTADSGARRVSDLDVALTSDIGRVRTENQDRLAVLRIQSRTRSFLVAALCDGMGGMADGGLSASISLSSFLSACVRYRDRAVPERLLSATRAANEAVYSAFKGKGGATLSAFIVDSIEGVGGVNVGDSRIYAVTQNSIEQLTQDDTIAGQVGAKNDGGDVHGRNDLLQYVGVGQEIEPHFVDLSSISDQSIIALTSDGVHFLNQNILRSIVVNAEDLKAAALRLSALSRWCGGKDNASALVATSINSLVRSTGSYLSSVIEVWDAFNEVQIINTNISREGQQNRPSSQSRINTLEEPSAIDKPKKKQRKKVPGGTKNKKQPTKKKAVAKLMTEPSGNSTQPIDEDKPQLKIDFNNNEDASRD